MTKDAPLTGQVAVVTGAAGGIGSAICRRLAQAGASVVLTDMREQDDIGRTMETLSGDHHVLYRADVTDSQAIKDMAAHVAERYGRLDILVNNAGFTRFVPHDDLEALEDELIDAIFRVNWRGAFACVRAFKDLLADDDGGLVVNISSIGGISGIGSNVAYCASKAAMHTMTLSLARALAPHIRVMSICPALVEGKYTSKLDPEWSKEQEEMAPLKRLVQAEDVADAVFSLAAYLTFSTGSMVIVDGGRLLT
jgi:3-oxoacyl-[acyl-carrier protein] reductase